jgi:protein-disulfide isomerase
MPHLIELFAAEHCPGCPDARIRLREFAANRRDVVVVERIVDRSLEAARRYGLFATPAIVVDGRAVLYGVPTIAQLAARCDERTAGKM